MSRSGISLREKYQNRGNPYMSARKVFGYPWSLTEKDVLAIMQNAPKEEDKVFTFKQLFLKDNLWEKCNIRKTVIHSDKEMDKICYRKFHWLVGFLQKHPSLLTPAMDEEIKKSSWLKLFFLTKSVKLAPIEHDTARLIVSQPPEIDSPLAREEIAKVEIMERMIDRINLTLGYMTANKIGKASIGTMSRLLENLVKSYTMFKGESTGRSFQEVKIKNLNVLQLRDLSQKSAQK